ncbi:MAG: glycoside hydrolase/phage tail family protein [Rhizobiales bacterium]|nr:glycoside hydrolase/phage tail family protein [Hyphomicrobiales bacterium]OJY43180.1 MAG: hypothetical protein BGP08_21170 [Rhizobiales bacterium 64-17]
MASLVLSVAGGAAGGALFGPVGAFAGRLGGALIGTAVDRALFSTTTNVTRTAQGPRLSDLDVMTSTEGAPIARAYGRVRLSGQVIWATNLIEVVTTRTETTSADGGGGGKGGGGGGSTVTTTTTTYSYFANLAVGLCEGSIGRVLRVWADGKPLDLSGVTMRQYRGDEAQMPDPLIVAKEGDAPAYRGLAYVVFERLPLENFGNRIPQLSFEIVRPVGRLERMTRAVTLIPGATEFGYEPGTVVQVMGPGQSAPENRHVTTAPSDVIASLDELQAVCPSLERVAIVVTWFGTDLRADQCEVLPSVDNAVKQTSGATWSVDGIVRSTARLVSSTDGRPSFGGTPSDASVIALIQELKARGLKVTLYPFLMMDIPAGNGLADPWTGAASQPVFPWRGRITCAPAPGQAGSPDGTPTAASQVATFFHRTNGYRRFIQHYAAIAVAAGGVDTFLIGSELRALTRVRAGAGHYPAVDELVSLAADVKAVLGGTLVTYAADWTEYGAHVVDAAAQEVRFPLDPLWASSAIGAVGLDYYAPLADWRDGADHADRALAQTIYDPDYLAGNLAGGEAYDWFYADDAARLAQTRTPITDGGGKRWIFRQKDIWNFWSNAHYERVGGVDLTTPTAWTPRSKPVLIAEVGCPAVDRGANQPSVFPDPRSSESGLPHFSDGSRDDRMQRRYLEAVLGALDPDAESGLNPLSPVYGAPMIDIAAVHLWTWDARPFPVFPAVDTAWSDAANWQTGHWLTGRLGGAPLDGLVDGVLRDCGIADVSADALGGGPDGYLVDRPMTPRAMLEPLATAYAFDAAEEGGVLRFRPRGGAPVIELTEDDLLLPDDAAPVSLTRAQETELPRDIALNFTDVATDYHRAAVASRRLTGGAAGTLQADLAVVTTAADAQRRADIWLQDLWAGRETATFALPPSALALSAGDVAALTVDGRRRLFEIRELNDGEGRRASARSIDPEVFAVALPPVSYGTPSIPAAVGPVHALTLDLPVTDGGEPVVLTRIAVCAKPWPGPVAVLRSDDGEAFVRAATAVVPAIVGETLDDLPRHVPACFQHRSVRVTLFSGALASVSNAALFDGANVAAVRRPDGAWEVLQFGDAELVDASTYALSRLLRGQGGTEGAMGDPLPAGAPFVLLDAHVLPLARGLDRLDRPMALRIVASGRDASDPSAVALDVTPSSTALRPLAPVHLAARRSYDGIVLSWIRRGRYDADSWSGEIPLGEASEQYAVDILDGGDVCRSLTAVQPSILYAAADELSDFGAPQSALTVRVSQLSATVGHGLATQATLSL